MKIVLLMMIGLAFAAENEYEIAKKKVNEKLCKNNADMKLKEEYLKCNNIVPKNVCNNY